MARYTPATPAPAAVARRHAIGTFWWCCVAPKVKPAAPWSSVDASRLLAAMISAVRAVPCRRVTRLTPGRLDDDCPLLAQGVRVLSQPPQAGGHPLRALRTGAARPPRAAPAWARVSCHADPVAAHTFAGACMQLSVWMWAPVPTSCARAVLDSGALDLLMGLVELGGAHAGRCALCLAERLRGRCRRDSSLPSGETATLLRPLTPASPPLLPMPQGARGGAPHRARGRRL